MQLILCGFFCAGKSSLGAACAYRLSLPFYDTDRIIEEREGGRAIGEIWRERGEEGFRAYEREVLLSLPREPAILSIGGGTLLLPENRAILREPDRCSVYLRLPLDTLYARALSRGLPAYLHPQDAYEHFREIALSRFPIYEKHSTHIIDGVNKEEKELLSSLVTLYERK
jgi:shikimate kinase